jgi:hypothetical protein
MHAVPSSFVRVGPVQRISSAFFIVASHSVRVGNRQSPGEDPSVNMQSPFPRPAAAFFADCQSMVDKQFTCFSQISPVTVSVTVPFPQSMYRFALSSRHGPAALGEGIRADGAGDMDVIDASVGPAGVMTIVASPISIVMKTPRHDLSRPA